MLRASLRRLEVMTAVVECGGVNAAALRLGISQPSVTAHLLALERNFSSKLFIRRRGTRNRLTAAGEALYRYALESIAQSAQLRQTLHAIDESQERLLVLAVQRSIADHAVPQALAAFLSRSGNARMSVYSDTQEAVLDVFRDGKADAAILFETPENASVEGACLGVQRLALVAAPSHPLACRAEVGVADLNDCQFVGGLPNSQFFKLVRTTLQEFGLANYNVGLHMQDSEGVKNAAALGLGIACTLASVVAPAIQEGKLTLLKTTRPMPALRVKAIISPNAPNRALLDEFLPFLTRSLVEG